MRRVQSDCLKTTQACQLQVTVEIKKAIDIKPAQKQALERLYRRLLSCPEGSRQ